MNWMINLTWLLFVTSLTGSIALVIWFFAKGIWERNGLLHWCYRGLWVITLLYFIPIAHIGMRLLKLVSPICGGVLFEPTSVLVDKCKTILGVWFFGMLIMGLTLLRDVLAMQRMKHTSVACERWEQNIFEEVCRELQISSKKIQLRRNYKMTMPSFGGVFRQVVIIPEIKFEEEQLHTILLHELTHYKQKISLLLFLARIVKVIHFFNPFVWQLSLLVEKWGEFDCDAKVYNKIGGIRNYFSIITDVLETVCESNAKMATYLSKGQCEVAQRIKYMKKYGNIRKKSLIIITLLAVFFVGAYSMTIVVAAKSAGDLYQYCYDMTVEEIEEVLETESIAEEYTDEGPKSNVTIVEDEVVQRVRAIQNFEWNVPSDYMKTTPSFAVKIGQKVSVNVYLEPRDKTVKVGIVDSSGKRRYILVKDSVYHDFTVPSSGTYRVFVENNCAVAIQVEGTYNVR